MIITWMRAANRIVLFVSFTAFAIAADGTASEISNDPKKEAAVAKDFGWRNTNIAGKAAGEIGGAVSSSPTPVYYADKIDPKSNNGELKASGSICLPKQPASKSAVFIGWFNSEISGWRYPTCAGFWVPGDDEPDDVVYIYGSRAFAKPTDFRVPRDGSRHTWTLTYDRDANEGNGVIMFALDGQRPFIANLPPNHLVKSHAFDRFGLLQTQASSNSLTLFLDDFQYDGKIEDFGSDPEWEKGGGGPAPEQDFTNDGRPRHANTAIPSQPLTQDSLEDRIKVEPNGALSFYTRNSENKLVKRFVITPEGSLVAGGTITNGSDIPLSNEPSMLHPSAYDNATNGARLSWVNDFSFGLHKSAGVGKLQGEGQPMLYLRVLGLMGRADSPDIQLGRAGPDDGRTNYGPLEATEPGNCLGKIIFKAYIKDEEKAEGEWTGDIAGMHARNEATPTREKSPASLHFTTAGASVKNNAWRENIERMVIRSNGYVAIGDEFNQPTERLHVQGNILAEGDLVSRGAKKFAIEHPSQPGKTLVHAALEGPEVAIYYRGEGRLVGGRAEVELPAYFETLARREGRTVMLTNVDGFDRLAIERRRGLQVADGRFIVVAEDPTSSQAFNWEVKAVRADVAPLQVEL